MTTKIFVGSLPSGCKPEELRRLFEDFGIVTECDIMNRCGFVHMEGSEMAANAIKALNGTQFKGQSINVEPGRLRDRDQKVPNASGGGGNRNRGGRGRGGGGGGGPRGMDFDGNATNDALELCNAVFEEMNKLLKPDANQSRQRGGSNAVGGAGNQRRDRNNSRNRPAIQNHGMGQNEPMNRGNTGPIRNERSAPHQNIAPYNRGGRSGGNNSVDDFQSLQSAQNFAKTLSNTANQIDNKWPNNVSGPVPLMNRNFDDNLPFNDMPRNGQQKSGNANNFGGNGNQSSGFSNRGNFGGNSFGGGNNDRPIGGNFSSGNQDRRGGSFQTGNDRFQNGNSFGLGNQDRRGFALPERQNFNERNGPGSGNRNTGGFGNNFTQESRGFGGNQGGNFGGGGNNNFGNKRNNNSGPFDGNNLNNRAFNNTNDFNRNGNFGGNNMNANNPGFNSNSPRGGGSNQLPGGNNRNPGIGRGMGNNGGNANRGNQGGMKSLNFQNDFPPLAVGGRGPNNNRNGPRQNMMSNRRY